MATISDTDLRLLIQQSYDEVQRNLVDFTNDIRTDNNDMPGKYSLRVRDLDKIFDASLWEDRTRKTGHRILKNRVTHIVINYSHHESDVDPGAAITILESVQEHINILHDQIFKYPGYGWNTPPNYAQSILNYRIWNASR